MIICKSRPSFSLSRGPGNDGAFDPLPSRALLRFLFSLEHFDSGIPPFRSTFSDVRADIPLILQKESRPHGYHYEP